MRGYLYSLATDRNNGFIAKAIKLFLLFLSFLYGLIVRALISFYSLRPYRLNCKVISVGNITLGGTGKTSLVEYIARYLKEHGHKVVIITRGYKRKSTGCQLPVASYENMGDEPFMLWKNLNGVPVIVDSDRIRGANRAIKEYRADTVILDDAFQQWKIKKDLEVVTIDTNNPFGNRCLIPRGILREPLSGLSRADIFILTKFNLAKNPGALKDYLKRINPSPDALEAVHKPLGFYKIDKPETLLAAQSLKGNTVTLFSGIGDPESFENLVKGLGIVIGRSFRFADHHNYTQKDLDKICQDSRERGINIIVTTEKDAARIPRGLSDKAQGLSMLILKITLEIKDEQRFRHRLLRIYSA